MICILWKVPVACGFLCPASSLYHPSSEALNPPTIAGDHSMDDWFPVINWFSQSLWVTINEILHPIGMTNASDCTRTLSCTLYELISSLHRRLDLRSSFSIRRQAKSQVTGSLSFFKCTSTCSYRALRFGFTFEQGSSFNKQSATITFSTPSSQTSLQHTCERDSPKVRASPILMTRPPSVNIPTTAD